MSEFRDKFLDALSKISRGSAVFLLLGLAFAGIFQVPAAQNLLADFLVSEKSDFVRDVSEKNISNIEKSLEGIPGAEDFLNDLKTWKTIKNPKIHEFENGLFLSLDAATGDILHHYFGFFRSENDHVVEVLWSPEAKAKVVKLEKTADEGYFALTLKNMGQFPWAANEKWENAINDEKAILVADTPVGADGTFVFRSSDGFLPKNATHGFVILGQ